MAEVLKQNNMERRSKSGPFKMKSPLLKNEYSKEAKNLLKVVPNQEAFNKLSDIDKRGFVKAAKKAGLPTKNIKASPAKGGWWAKQTKGHGGPS